ncbi:MAG: YbaN family protein [Anaerolineaceae bacterium]|nr:YbaN family protein [Anaerolineaceae bacterium]
MKENKKSIKRIFYIILGFIGVGLGAVGAVVPMLPAFPFLMLAAFAFGRSSEKLDNWFKNTKLYKNNLETYIKGQGMTRKTKIRVMITITILMSFGFYMMFRRNLFIPCAILVVVWLFHILYFSLGVKNYEIKPIKSLIQKDGL